MRAIILIGFLLGGCAHFSDAGAYVGLSREERRACREKVDQGVFATAEDCASATKSQPNRAPREAKHTPAPQPSLKTTCTTHKDFTGDLVTECE